jgi:hypothetical protein
MIGNTKEQLLNLAWEFRVHLKLETMSGNGADTGVLGALAVHAKDLGYYKKNVFLLISFKFLGNFT